VLTQRRHLLTEKKGKTKEREKGASTRQKKEERASRRPGAGGRGRE